MRLRRALGVLFLAALVVGGGCSTTAFAEMPRQFGSRDLRFHFAYPKGFEVAAPDRRFNRFSAVPANFLVFERAGNDEMGATVFVERRIPNFDLNLDAYVARKLVGRHFTTQPARLDDTEAVRVDYLPVDGPSSPGGRTAAVIAFRGELVFTVFCYDETPEARGQLLCAGVLRSFRFD